MIPDWSKAPEWANFCAMDNDGSRWWFEKEPQLVGGNYMAEKDSQSALITDCDPYMWERPGLPANAGTLEPPKRMQCSWGLPAKTA